ncbi:MAG: T9SS type A sorting domain-containing protein [Candidatus Cloacimonetes bacterium]|nr:T9SS type A sorting domain-containing protein [Candidatus Cloacimonadota bacterium]
MKIKLLILCSFCLFSSLLNSTIWHIKQDGTGNFTTIQEGINSSVDSDTVLVYPGMYYENLNIDDKNITLASLEMITGDPQYIATTIIDGQRQNSCIILQYIDIDVIIRGFTIQNGYGTFSDAYNGGGIYAIYIEYGTIMNCYFKKNLSTRGGAIYTCRVDLTFAGLRINENSAGLGGAAFWDYDSDITFDPDNRCNIFNNNAGKGADLCASYEVNVNVIVDTFTVFNPDRFFAEYLDEALFSFDIQHNWMELVSQDLYVTVDGDDENSGLTPDEPLKNISWAVRKIQADEQNPHTIHVAAGTYSHEINQQIFPIGCKEYVSIIGEYMGTTILNNDSMNITILGLNLDGFAEISNFTIQNDFDFEANCILNFRSINYLKVTNITIDGNSNIRCVIEDEYVENLYDNIIVTNNTAKITAGFALFENTGILRNCVISNNSLVYNPIYPGSTGLHLNAYDHFNVENTVISNCTSYDDASCVSRLVTEYGHNDHITMNNCLISGNSSHDEFVIVSGGDGNIEINNSTIVDNYNENNTIKAFSNLTLRNTIMHNNTDYEIYLADDTQYGYTYELDMENCNIKNGEAGIYNENNANIINWGEGNIDEDPQFAGVGENPYQLTAGSPCVDTGTPDTTGLFLPPWDLLHNQRVWDGDENGIAIIDMGCYEFGADSVNVINNELPITNFKLQNYPNPFNPETKIVFDLPESGNVKLEIYNVKGQKVKTLLDCYMSPGRSEMIWNSRDDKGRKVSSGVYFYKLETNERVLTKKMLLLK